MAPTLASQLGLGLAALLAALLLRRILGAGGGADPRATDLDVHAHAWLCGGEPRAARTMLTALYERGVLACRPHRELDDFFLEVTDPAVPLRGLELAARDLLWVAWGARGARLDEAEQTLRALTESLRKQLVALGLVRSRLAVAAMVVLPALLALAPALLAPSAANFATCLPLVAGLICIAPGRLAPAGLEAAARFCSSESSGRLPGQSRSAVQAVAARGDVALPVELGLCTLGPRNRSRAIRVVTRAKSRSRSSKLMGSIRTGVDVYETSLRRTLALNRGLAAFLGLIIEPLILCAWWLGLGDSSW